MTIMSPKLIFLFAALCVVKASVITGNILGDDGPDIEEPLPESEVSTLKSTCNFAECSRLCRQIGLPHASCVNGRCRCRNFVDEAGEVSYTEGPMTDSVEAQAGRCFNWKCNSVCRRRGYNSGTCDQNGRCKCEGSRNKTAEVSQTEDPMAESVEALAGWCFNWKCNFQCRNRGYNSGTCDQNGRCKCEGSRNKTAEVSDPEDPMADSVEAQAGRCFNWKCNSQCRRSGYSSGTCNQNGRCKCAGSRDKTAEDSEAAVPLSDSVDIQSGSCFNQKCNSQCRKSGFYGGTCVDNRCKCHIPRDKAESSPSPTDDVINDVDTDEPEEIDFIFKTQEEGLLQSSSSSCNCNCNCHCNANRNVV